MQIHKYSDWSVWFELESWNYISDSTLFTAIGIIIREWKFEFLRFMNMEWYSKKDIKEIIEYMKNVVNVKVL